MTDIPALVEPNYKPTRHQLAALRRLATATYRQRTTHWTSPMQAPVTGALVDDLRRAGCVTVRSGATGIMVADVTPYGRHVIAWYCTNAVARRR